MEDEARVMNNELNEEPQAVEEAVADVVEDNPQDTAAEEKIYVPQLMEGFNDIAVEDMDAVKEVYPNLILLDAIVWDKAGAKEILERINESGSSVRYFSDSEASEDMNKLELAIADAKEKVGKYAEEHSVRLFTSKTIGCKKCGSQLAKEFLKTDMCPLCGNDLRSQTTIDGEKKLVAKVTELEKALKDATLFNLISKGKLVWLVYIK